MIHLGAVLSSDFGAQDGPRQAQEAAKMAKTAPRGRQDGPKTAPRRPKMAPRWLQDGHETISELRKERKIADEAKM